MSREFTPLTAGEILPNAEYLANRKEFRAQALEYRRQRTVALGPQLSLSFENRHTVRYQLQEMLAAEDIVEPRAVARALAACNALIPDGLHWKAGCVVVGGAKGKGVALERLRGAHRAIWMRIAELPRLAADLEDEGDSDDTVHVLRFTPDALQLAVLRAGAAIRMGVDLDGYRHEVEMPAEVRASLLTDLAPPN